MITKNNLKNTASAISITPEQFQKIKKISIDKVKSYLEVALLCAACITGVWKTFLIPMINRIEERNEKRIEKVVEDVTDKIINKELRYVHDLLYLSTTQEQRDSATILYKNYLERIENQKEYDNYEKKIIGRFYK